MTVVTRVNEGGGGYSFRLYTLVGAFLKQAPGLQTVSSDSSRTVDPRHTEIPPAVFCLPVP